MNIIKDGIVIDVTKKAFDVIYKDKGYVIYNADNVGNKVPEVDYDDLTKNEIIDKLNEKEVEHDPQALKADLLEILKSDE